MWNSYINHTCPNCNYRMVLQMNQLSYTQQYPIVNTPPINQWYDPRLFNIPEHHSITGYVPNTEYRPTSAYRPKPDYRLNPEYRPNPAYRSFSDRKYEKYERKSSYERRNIRSKSADSFRPEKKHIDSKNYGAENLKKLLHGFIEKKTDHINKL